MNPKALICNSSKITYSKGYIALWLEDYPLPSTLKAAGETLLKKDHFHVSLLCVKNIIEAKSEVEEEVLKHFCDFIKIHPIEFTRYTGEFRLATHEERRSVVAMCTVSNLNEFADYLSEKIGLDVPHQPAHVTIYTLQPSAGIGLNSAKELQEKTVPFLAPEEIIQILK